jgi:hypothetical protein
MTRPLVDPARQDAMRAIGELVFQIAFEGGQSTPFDEALAEALTLLDDISPPEVADSD